LTGETQLRARRTRIKILKAIAERNGTAGFSEIRDATGLSTGSIYYHLERMNSYVVKESKHYALTEQGLDLLREIENKSRSSDTSFVHTSRELAPVSSASPSANSQPERDNAESSKRSSVQEETLRVAKTKTKTKRSITRLAAEYPLFVAVAAIGGLVIAGWFANWPTITYLPRLFDGGIVANASLLSSISIIALLSISFLVIIRSKHNIASGYRGLMLSVATVLSILLVNSMIFEGLGAYIGASNGGPYDNSMDALLSSYSLHWGLH
jgi:DNA-binding PadR family transcriptional regulator